MSRGRGPPIAAARRNAYDRSATAAAASLSALFFPSRRRPARPAAQAKASVGDLGGEEDDRPCTGRRTSRVNVETALAQTITPGGAFPIVSWEGVDVLHVNHHGSESSTNSDYMNLLKPEVVMIAVGTGQNPTWQLPRTNVVDNVLLAGVSCITAPAALVLQTEDGSPSGPNTSFSGYPVEDIIIRTDEFNYTIEATGRITQGRDERARAGLPLTLPTDE